MSETEEDFRKPDESDVYAELKTMPEDSGRLGDGASVGNGGFSGDELWGMFVEKGDGV